MEIAWFDVNLCTPDDGEFVLICSRGGRYTYYAQFKDGKFLAENSAQFFDYNKGGGETAHLPAHPTHWALLPHIDGVSQRGVDHG